jgi:hypothetical protein
MDRTRVKYLCTSGRYGTLIGVVRPAAGRSVICACLYIALMSRRAGHSWREIVDVLFVMRDAKRQNVIL